MSSAQSSSPFPGQFKQTRTAQAAGADPAFRYERYGSYETADIDLRSRKQKLMEGVEKFVEAAKFAAKGVIWCAKVSAAIGQKIIEMMMKILRMVARFFGARITEKDGAQAAASSLAGAPKQAGPNGPREPAFMGLVDEISRGHEHGKDAEVGRAAPAPDGAAGAPGAPGATVPLLSVAQLVAEKADDYAEMVSDAAESTLQDLTSTPEGSAFIQQAAEQPAEEAAESLFEKIIAKLSERLDLIDASHEKEVHIYKEALTKLKADASIAHGIPEDQVDEVLSDESHEFGNAQMYRSLKSSLMKVAAEKEISASFQAVLWPSLVGAYRDADPQNHPVQARAETPEQTSMEQSEPLSDSLSPQANTGEFTNSGDALNFRTTDEKSTNHASNGHNTHASSETISSTEHAALEPDGPLNRTGSRMVSDAKFMAAASRNAAAYGIRSPEAGDGLGDESDENRRDQKTRPHAA